MNCLAKSEDLPEDHFMEIVKVPNHPDGKEMSGASALPKCAGKEAADSGVAAEKRVLVIDMTEVRKMPCNRFLAVVFFLSVLLVNSRQLIDHMKKVWKSRGEMDDSPMKAEMGRKFILEFSEEGDWKHVILCGPW